MGVHASSNRLKRELAAVSPMQSHKPKRDLADFFKPYARNIPESTIPRKRASPSTDDPGQHADTIDAKIARVAPKTPVRTVSFKDVTPSPRSSVKRAIFPSRSDGALPIRSPKTTKSPVISEGNNRQRTLFETSSPPKLLREPESKTAPCASFSFSDISERSQSVIQDGKVVVVLDSDDDDLDSIKSLDEILGRRKREPEPKPIPTERASSSFGSSQDEDVDNEAARISILSKFTQGRSVPIIGKTKLREFYAKKRQLKFDLSMILDDHFEDIEAVERARQARMETDSEDENEQDSDETDRKLLAEVVLNGGEDMDADDVNRVLSAMERTEALAGDRKFSFFDWRGIKDRRAKIEATEFPQQGIPLGLWTHGQDENAQVRAFLSGIMVEKAAAGTLNEQAFRWTFWESLREQRPELQQAYMRVIEAGSSLYTRLYISAVDVHHVFERLGAAPETLQNNGPISRKHQVAHREINQNSAQLIQALQVFQTISQDLDMSALSILSSMALRLSLDDAVMTDGNLASMVEALLESMVNHKNHNAQIHIHNRLLEDSTLHLHDPLLQAKFLTQIPPTSEAATRLRKTLADAFLLGRTLPPKPNMTAEASLAMLNKQIHKHPIFSITSKPQASPDDYAALAATVAILDVAIGSGHAAHPPLRSSTTASTDSTSLQLSSRHDEQVEPSIRSFNASVDALADSLHTIFISIKDTGASHMRRTEAKDALQALHYRCLYGVRIGVRKKKHVFDIVSENNNTSSNRSGGGGNNASSSTKIVGVDGDQYREQERAKEAMGRFLDRIRSSTKTPQDVGGGGDVGGGEEPLSA